MTPIVPKLAVMVVIGSRTANYIKLVAGDHIEFSRSKRKHVISDDRADRYDFGISGTPLI